MTIPYQQIELAGDIDLEFFIRHDLEREPADCLFEACEIALAAVADQGAVSEAEDYLLDGDEDSYNEQLGKEDDYRDGGADALPPIVVARRADGLLVLDGRRRISAAAACGLTSLPAYELLDAQV